MSTRPGSSRTCIATGTRSRPPSKGELIKHVNEEGVAMGMNPFDFGSKKYTDVMKTDGLKQALTKYEFDCAFGGARRDEEKSRAKERIFSFRDSHHQWDPKNQRPELWNVYNAKIKKGENVRVFPLSNWTELDVWLYVWLEDIPVVPLYFAKERPVVERSGTWILVDDDRMRLEEGEKPQMKKVRFRTLGCYPLERRCRIRGRYCPEGHPGNAPEPLLRTAGAPHRFRRRGVDGSQEARGLLLGPPRASSRERHDGRKRSDSRRYRGLSREVPKERAAPIRVGRLRRRRQVHADRAHPLRHRDGVRRPNGCGSGRFAE